MMRSNIGTNRSLGPVAVLALSQSKTLHTSNWVLPESRFRSALMRAA